MIKISLTAIIDILTTYNYKFIIEQDGFFDDGRKIYRFITAKDYPSNQSWIMPSDFFDQEKIKQSRTACKGEMVLSYDHTNKVIIGAKYPIYQMFKDYLKQKQEQRAAIS